MFMTGFNERGVRGRGRIELGNWPGIKFGRLEALLPNNKSSSPKGQKHQVDYEQTIIC